MKPVEFVNNPFCGGDRIVDFLDRSGVPSLYRGKEYTQSLIALHASFRDHLGFMSLHPAVRPEVVYLASVRDPYEKARAAWCQWGGGEDFETWIIGVYCEIVPVDRDYLECHGDWPDSVIRHERLEDDLAKFFDQFGYGYLWGKISVDGPEFCNGPEHNRVTMAAINQRYRWTFKTFGYPMKDKPDEATEGPA